MALTAAHYEGRARSAVGDIVEAMTTVESGTAVNVEYIPEETRAVAIHEAGHAVAGHVYMKGVESTRLSIRKRGSSLGHHQALEKEERFSSWRHEEIGRLVWTLGAMAAEHVFYGENSTGVGGDVMSATTRAALDGGIVRDGAGAGHLQRAAATTDEEREEARKQRAEALRDDRHPDHAPVGRRRAVRRRPDRRACSSDRDKRATAAQLLGQAYVAAYRPDRRTTATAVEQVADVLVERREMHGDEVVELLDSLDLKVPEVDLLEESSWPTV